MAKPRVNLTRFEDNTALSGTSQPLRLVGQKPPLKPSGVWVIRTRLRIPGKRRDLVLFNFAIDSKLRKGCTTPLKTYQAEMHGG